MPANAMMQTAVFFTEKDMKMAAFETTYIPANGASFGGRLSTVIRGAVASFAAWKDARSTRNALLQLSDRDLDDIGLCRADIEKL